MLPLKFLRKLWILIRWFLFTRPPSQGFSPAWLPYRHVLAKITKCASRVLASFYQFSLELHVCTSVFWYVLRLIYYKSTAFRFETQPVRLGLTILIRMPSRAEQFIFKLWLHRNKSENKGCSAHFLFRIIFQLKNVHLHLQLAVKSYSNSQVGPGLYSCRIPLESRRFYHFMSSF